MDTIQNAWTWLMSQPFQVIALVLLLVAIALWYIPPFVTLKDIIASLARQIVGIFYELLPYTAFTAAVLFVLWLLWGQ